MYPALSRFCLRPVVHLTALAVILSWSEGELIIAPRDTESKVGDTTYFNCSTDYEAIVWKNGDKDIYRGGEILAPYRGRFHIDKGASSGEYNLVIHSVEIGDAGDYICIDGQGREGLATLVVIENDPDCKSNMQQDGVIGQNIFNVPLDVVQLTCTVVYHGTNDPEMEWVKVGENSPTKDGDVYNSTSGNRSVYTLNLTGDISLDKSSYMCQTTRAAQNQYKCYSEPIKVLYFIERNKTEQDTFRGDQITCATTNDTIPCTNQWFRDSNTCPISCDKTTEARYLGVYVCKLMCHVRGAYYFVETLKVHVTESTTCAQGYTKSKILAAALVPSMFFLVALIILIIIAIFLCRERKRSEKYKEAASKRASKNQRPIEEGIQTDFTDISELSRVQTEARSNMKTVYRPT